MFLILLLKQTTGCFLESSCTSYLVFVFVFVFNSVDTTSSVSSWPHLIKLSWQQISLINWKQCVLPWYWRSCSRRRVCQYTCKVRVGHFKPSCLAGDWVQPRSLSHEKLPFFWGWELHIFKDCLLSHVIEINMSPVWLSEKENCSLVFLGSQSRQMAYLRCYCQCEL